MTLKWDLNLEGSGDMKPARNSRVNLMTLTCDLDLKSG